MKRLALLEPGTRIDQYVVVDTLGQGGMAVVYRVRHRTLGSVHALKVVVVPSRNIMTRLLSEGRAQARLRHRNIVQVTNVIEVDGSPGLVMEYVPGPSLEKLLHNVTLDLDTLDRLGRQILRGIAAAHDAGLIHRDLKPANILCSFEEDGLIPKIADFGLVKDTGTDAGDTRTNSVMGTPNYMSPEQIRDTKSVDLRTDLFAAGAILYELLTRKLAFPGEDVLDVFNHVAAGQYTPVRELRPDAPDRMLEAIESALRVKREQRPASAQQLLERWCGDVTDRALPPMSLPAETVEWIRSATLVPPDATPVPSSESRGGTISVDDLNGSPTTSRGTGTTGEALARRAPWFAVAGASGVGLAVLAVVACTGVGGATVLATGTWWRAPELADVQPPVPVDSPIPLPEPPPPPPNPEPPDPERPAPPPPEPIGKAPIGKAPVQPVPPPPPVVPVPTPPVPLPDAEPAQLGAVSVSGAKAMLEGAGGVMLKTGNAIPPGPYTVVADFDNGRGPTKVLDIVVVAGKTTRLSCALGKCIVSR
jgi:serine/threonine protein kinase